MIKGDLRYRYMAVKRDPPGGQGRPPGKVAKGVVAELKQLFGALADRNDGETKDDSKRGARTLMTTLAKIKKVSQGIREVTVTVPLEKALSAECPDDFVTKIKFLSAFVAILRVTASHLANFIFYEAFSSSGALPTLDEKFFTGCLTACRSQVTKKDGDNFFDAAFKRFSKETDTPSLIPPPGITQICVWQAKEMFTAAKNMVNLGNEKRRLSIIRWALKRIVYTGEGSPAVSKAVNEKIHRVAKFIVRSTPNSLSDMSRDATEADLGETVCADLASLLSDVGMSHHLAAITILHTDEVSAAPKCDTLEGCVKHLHDLQLKHIHADRRTYEALCREVSNKVAVTGEAFEAEFKKGWAGDSPPGEKCPLPVCHNQSAMLRIDMKALKELCKDERVQLLANGAFWYKCVINPHSKQANIPCLRAS
jgi:hypothetical protein